MSRAGSLSSPATQAIIGSRAGSLSSPATQATKRMKVLYK